MRRIATFIACLLLVTIPAHAEADYKVGDRLAKPEAGAARPSGFKETSWDSLIPKSWDPVKELRAMNLGALSDGDARAQAVLTRMQELWAKAPVEPTLDGAQIRIAGFMVPLESAKGEVSEFLLVPYFGACIHVPPPPANQIIDVVAATPAKGYHMMDAVWVNGTLRTVRSENHAGMGMANSGYRLEAYSIEAYRR